MRRMLPQSALQLAGTGLFVALLAVTHGCDSAVPPGVGNGEGPGGRSQPLGVSAEKELELGRRAYREVLREVRGQDILLAADSPETQRVRQVFTRVVKAAGIEPLQREINLRVRGFRFEWEANVVRQRQVNAFCVPGGKIMVFTGLLDVCTDDDQLATVIAHEVAHALAHHGSERLAREEPSGLFAVLRTLEYDRMQESEADHIGVFLMAFAGYNPDVAVRFWQRMSHAHGRDGAPPEILSDHPSDARRIEDLRRWAPQARAAKEAFDEGRIAPPTGK